MIQTFGSKLCICLFSPPLFSGPRESYALRACAAVVLLATPPAAPVYIHTCFSCVHNACVRVHLLYRNAACRATEMRRARAPTACARSNEAPALLFNAGNVRRNRCQRRQRRVAGLHAVFSICRQRFQLQVSRALPPPPPPSPSPLTRARGATSGCLPRTTTTRIFWCCWGS